MTHRCSSSARYAYIRLRGRPVSLPHAAAVVGVRGPSLEGQASERVRRSWAAMEVETRRPSEEGQGERSASYRGQPPRAFVPPGTPMSAARRGEGLSVKTISPYLQVLPPPHIAEKLLGGRRRSAQLARRRCRKPVPPACRYILSRATRQGEF